MLSRRFFTFWNNFNILTTPIYVAAPNVVSFIPPVSGYIITEDNNNVVMENGVDFMITE